MNLRTYKPLLHIFQCGYELFIAYIHQLSHQLCVVLKGCRLIAMSVGDSNMPCKVPLCIVLK